MKWGFQCNFATCLSVDLFTYAGFMLDIIYSQMPVDNLFAF